MDAATFWIQRQLAALRGDRGNCRTLSAIVVAALLISGCGVCGCGVWRGPAPTPNDRTAVLEQLVVHSDFELPRTHRLLEELKLQRFTVASKLGLPISDEPIHVYLFSDADKFHAFMRANYPSFPDRRAFFVETDTQLKVFAYWGDRVAEDLRHEVAHGYLHAVIPRLPLWLDEGLAEYFETPRNAAGLNAAHVEELKTRLAEGWAPNLRRLEALEDAAAMTQTQYAESWAWVYFLLHRSPEHQQMLKDYLQLLFKADNVEPLAHRMRRLHLDYELQLVNYVKTLPAALR